MCTGAVKVQRAQPRACIEAASSCCLVHRSLSASSHPFAPGRRFQRSCLAKTDLTADKYELGGTLPSSVRAASDSTSAVVRR